MAILLGFVQVPTSLLEVKVDGLMGVFDRKGLGCGVTILVSLSLVIFAPRLLGVAHLSGSGALDCGLGRLGVWRMLLESA